MIYRDIPIKEFSESFDYLEGAERFVNGFRMRGGLLNKRLSRVVCGSMTELPTSAPMVGFMGTTWFLYRVIFALHNGPIPDHVQIDHQDHDRSHNKIENLRALSPSQNQMNRASSRVGSRCKFIGVSVSGNGFNAFVSEKGKPLYLGHFTDERAAALARDKEVLKRHGSYASLNCDLFESEFT